jgi:hypothetical protein
VERLVEDLALVAAVHEHRVQRPVEVVALLESGRFDRLDGAQHLARTDAQAGGAQGAGEVHDVIGEPAVGALGRGGGFGQGVHYRLAPSELTPPSGSSPPLGGEVRRGGGAPSLISN